MDSSDVRKKVDFKGVAGTSIIDKRRRISTIEVWITSSGRTTAREEIDEGLSASAGSDDSGRWDGYASPTGQYGSGAQRVLRMTLAAERLSAAGEYSMLGKCEERLALERARNAVTSTALVYRENSATTTHWTLFVRCDRTPGIGRSRRCP
ncbi:unnamed protein product [Phaeothamnion confervicola]